MDTGLDEDLQQRLINSRLPSLPAVAVQLIALGRSASANVGELVEIVSNDPAVAASLVRMANSAAFRRIRPADTVSLAISYLGFQRSRLIALSATLLPALTHSRQPAFCYRPFWRRALIGGACAHAIAGRLFPADTESLFLAALLQDIGVLALAQLPLGIYDQADCSHYAHEQLLRHERRAIREDHAAVGAWLLERWSFPPKLVQAVRVSNNPALPSTAMDDGDFQAAVIAAGFMADAWMWDGSPPDLAVLRSDISRLLQVEWREVLALFSDAATEIPLVEALCAVEVTDPASMQLALALLSGSEEDGVPDEGEDR